MKTGTKVFLGVFLGVLASAILVGGLGALTRGFTNWDPDTWLDQWKGKEDDSGEDLNIDGDGINLLIQGGPKFATQSSVGDYKKVIATLNQEAMDKRIKWTSSDESKVDFDRNVSQSGEGVEVRLKSLFAGEVTVTASAYLQPEVKAEFKVTYDNAVQSLEFVGIAGATTSDDHYEIENLRQTIEEEANRQSLFDWAAGNRAETLILESTAGSGYGVTIGAGSFGTEHHFYNIDFEEEMSGTVSLFGDNAEKSAYGFLIFYGHGAEGAEALDPATDAVIKEAWAEGDTSQEITETASSYVDGNDVVVLLPINDQYLPTEEMQGNCNVQCDNGYGKIYTGAYSKATTIGLDGDVEDGVAAF